MAEILEKINQFDWQIKTTDKLSIKFHSSAISTKITTKYKTRQFTCKYFYQQ